MPDLADDIMERLRPVMDPELGESIVDLGMIYGVSVDGAGVATVLLTTTARFCPAAELLQQAVAERAGTAPGVSAVRVVMTYDPPWTPDRISGSARRLF